ncbi:MAG TPA: helix-turn-helix transcriptional regulator [Ktedonobacterales bacterium]|nr:helix-turn-helix transcriptional regulator [Ktedonobacterales bacterium]
MSQGELAPFGSALPAAYPAGASWEDGSFILSERARRHRWQGVGQLSIKTFPVGEAYYSVGSARYLLDSRAYLVLNEGQSYEIDVAADTPVESFCVFFAPGAALDAQRALTARTEALLDDPHAPSPDAAAGFFERLYPHDDLVSPQLEHIRGALAQPETERLWLAERMREALMRLCAAHQRVWGEVNALPAVRVSTREEIYRRLYYARDYAVALLHEPLTLDELARVAVMSPTHFLRVFRQAFGQTPHQFLTERRIERAKDLLRMTNRPVTDICLAVGFESLGSFSALFRRRVGVSPAAYRRLNAD